MTTKGKPMGKEKKKKGTVWKRMAILLLLFCLFALIAVATVYVVDYIRIKDRFGGNIWVNDHHVVGMTAEKAAEKMDEEFRSRKVHVMEGEEEALEFTVGEAGYHLNKEPLIQQMNKIIADQEVQFSLLKEKKEFDLEYELKMDTQQFEKNINASDFKGERTTPEDAYIEYDEEQKRYVIVPDVVGTEISEEGFMNSVKDFLDKELANKTIPEEIYMELNDSSYVKANVTSESETLVQELNTLNGKIDQYVNSTVTHVFGDTKEVITSEMISQWIVVDGKEVTLPEEPVRQYVEALSEEYNTMYRERIFTTTAGQQVEMEHNEYGYLIDKEEEFKQLYQDLSSGQSVEREPVYKERGYKRNGKDDIVGCYIEISLDQQHLWLYKDGQLVTETDIISGLPTPERQTYRGAWPVFLKASPFTLTSEEYGYSVEVQYWMPFVYGQGLHDAGWQHQFGGEVYKTRGSHGCINLPPDQAKIIYDTVDKGYPILLY